MGKVERVKPAALLAFWGVTGNRLPKDAWQYADYEWLKGTPHYKATSK